MNKLCNFMVLFMALSGNVYAQKTEPWNDPLVNNINRNEPVSDFFGYENKELSDRNDKKLSRDSCLLKEFGNSIGCRMPMSVL